MASLLACFQGDNTKRLLLRMGGSVRIVMGKSIRCDLAFPALLAFHISIASCSSSRNQPNAISDVRPDCNSKFDLENSKPQSEIKSPPQAAGYVPTASQSKKLEWPPVDSMDWTIVFADRKLVRSRWETARASRTSHPNEDVAIRARVAEDLREKFDVGKCSIKDIAYIDNKTAVVSAEWNVSNLSGAWYLIVVTKSKSDNWIVFRRYCMVVS